jgi:hypothetical protein
MNASGMKRADPASITVMSNRDVIDRLRSAAYRHGEELIAELPATVRRVRTLVLVMTIAIPSFLAALVVILWRVAG